MRYVVNIDADEPIMLLNKQIGRTYTNTGDWDGEDYIDGAEFQSELMQLDALNKKSIKIIVNSIGGAVFDGLKIIDAILTTKTPVDTHNGGVAASIALPILCAGRKRTGYDYAKAMTHEVGGNGSEKTKEALTDAISKVMNVRSNLSQNTFEYMMAKTTWISGDECYTYGIYTEAPVNTSDTNRKYMSTVSSPKDMLSYTNKLITNELNQINNMDLKQITNKLGLVDGASLESIDSAIEALKTAKNQAEDSMTAMESELSEAKATLATAQANVEALQTKVDAAEQAQKDAEAMQRQEQATNMVKTFTNKIGNKPEMLQRWVNRAVENFEDTKAELEDLPLNVQGGKIDVEQSYTGWSVQAELNTINNKLKQN